MYSVLRASAARAASSSGAHVCAKRAVNNVSRRDVGHGSSFAARTTARRYAATAVAASRRHPSSSTSSSSSTVYLDDAEDSRRSSSSPRASSSYPPPPKYFSRTKADSAPIVEHLQELFPGLEFPPELAVQMLTHASAKEAWAASNTRLSYVGRRVISTYLLLFLHHATTRLSSSSSSHILSPSSSQFDFDAINYRATYTALIGEHVGRAWNLQRSMLWTPPVSLAYSSSPLSTEERIGGSSKAPGLYKVQGTTVEAIMGGLYHQFGGLVTQRAFHTRFLPHILCPGESSGLHDAFHGAAREMMERMGGPDCSFSSSNGAKNSKLLVDGASIKEVEAQL
ncbi:hypothetical protein SCHPADRAFT_881219 [Schizopora paradoxa]|uniref:RNase III domain-containing protein n=1 Tax=Schizopora paradoxa TaxID=27342 RepID=A0A0H2R7H5_9AGAM|nr:hypothetical protein SCHPADRAFT_881219 [Schizopora paradoxa]